MKRTLSIILSLLMVLSLFTGLNISAAETDAADTGAEAELAETGIDVEVTMPAQLKAALEANDGEGTVRNIKVMHDFTYWTGVKGDNGTASYVPTWCTIGSGIKNLMLNGHKLTFENDYAVTTAHPEMSYSELEEVNTLTLFSIPAGAELYVRDSTYTHSGIWYNGQILKNKDGIDNRDIFHVDGGKLVITGGSYSTEYRTQVYDYGGFSGLGAIHRLQVNGTPVTVNSGTAVINGGYFEGRGFSRYFYYESPSSKQPKRNGAIKFWGGRLIVNGGYFYGDNGAVAINSIRNSNYKLLTFNGGRFAVDTHDAHIGTEKGENCENTGCIGLCFYMPINGDNYNYWLSYRDGKGNTYSYQDAVDNKIKMLDDDSEVQFYIEPKGTGYTYRFNANDQLLDESGLLDDYYILWANDEPLQISIEPESMSFFGANFNRNSIGQRLTATLTANDQDGKIAIDEPVTFSLSGGKWTLDLADYINKNLLNRMIVNRCYNFNFSFTEEQDYSWHNGAKKTYTVKHDAYISVLYKNAEYTLTFDPYGGKGAAYTTTAVKGEAYTLPNCPFGAPDGEEFDCWEILVSETGRRYGQPGDSYTPKGNDTIRARWKSVYSTVTLQANNGTGETKQLKVLRGGTLKLPPCEFEAPENSTFYDWQTLDQYGMRYKVGDEITVTKDMTLQAMWEYPPDDIALMTFTITAPEVGAHPDTTCTSMNPDRYYAKFHAWYIMENGRVVEWMSPDDVFEAGKSYAFGIDIKVLKGRKTEDTKIYIGGKEAKSIAPSVCEYFSVFTMPGVVDKVEVSLTKPQAGEVPDYNAVVPENEYYERWEYDWTANGSQIYGGVSWFDHTDQKVLAPTDTFIAGHSVTARVFLQTKNPHTFAPKEEMDFGENYSGSGGWDETRGSVIYNFIVAGEKYPVWLGSTQVCEENCDDILGDHKASYDPETHTLTLDYPTFDDYYYWQDYFYVNILSEGIDLTVKGGYTMPSEKDNAWFGVAAIGGTLTLDGDFTFYGSNAAVWGGNGVYITGGDIVAEGVWSGIEAGSSEAPISIGASVDRVKTSSAKAGYYPISGKLELADNIVLTENGYQPGGSHYYCIVYERKGSELETGNFSIDDPLAGMTLPTGDMLFDSDLYLGVTDEDYGYINGVRWHDADDNVLPADYTPQSGETVYLDIYLKPAGDNVFTEDTVLTVNGIEVACQLVAGRYLMADNIAFTVGGEAAEYLLGDADGDNDVTSVDLTYVQRHCALLKVDIDEKLLMNADVDGNGILEITDATYIQRWLARMDIPYTIGEAIS